MPSVKTTNTQQKTKVIDLTAETATTQPTTRNARKQTLTKGQIRVRLQEDIQKAPSLRPPSNNKPTKTL